MMDIVFDIETYPNCFTLAAEHADYPLTWGFEISDYRNDYLQMCEWLRWIDQNNGRLVGFNNLGFDYPIIHMMVKQGVGSAAEAYAKCQAIIQSQDSDRFTHIVYPDDRIVEQIDLFKIHHFDNKARATSLKALEFNMRLDNVSDLPFPVGTPLNQEQIKVLKEYNAHDVTATKLFYQHTKKMIAFREELTSKYDRDFMNHNDTKIGKDFFTMELESAGVQCYTYGKEGRKPKQTLRPQIALKDAILPWVQFQEPEFNRILNWMKAQVITETKGVFDKVTAMVGGFEFVFGLGGIHGSLENEIVDSDDEYAVIDLDVTSYYPSLAIHNKFRPEHLGATFCTIYENLKAQRVTYAKGTAENAMLKLALNGVYGDSNNKFSVFYDPLFTMSITLNGQLLLCLLAETLLRIQSLKIIQVNTDGMTIKVLRSDEDKVNQVRQWWEQATGMQLEEARYKRMAIRDVNNYLAVYEKGGVKRKGAYEYDLEWHQNGSCLVVPKVAEKVLTEGAPIMETLKSHPDIMDFMLRVKVPRTSRLLYTDEHGEHVIQNTTRYYVSEGGGTLTKVMPPLPKKPDGGWRRFAVEKGRSVCVCNKIEDAVLPIDYSYYAVEIEKLTLGMR